ncbi:MAG: RNA methyltransferase [Oscillospiraceae bacterium]|nr:RNA methyltransferase [Oscillospiraceae bacterium]
MQEITSRKNPLIAHIKKLFSDGACRREYGELVCEGEKLLQEAVSAGMRIKTVLTCADIPDLPEGAELIRTTKSIIESLSSLRSSREIIFTCSLPDTDLPALPGGRYVLLDGVQDPGNLGTVARSANAFGFDGVLLCGACADPYSPKTLRACMGALFHIPVYRVSVEDVKKLVDSGEPLWGTFPAGEAEDIRNVVFTNGMLAIGSEGRGISEEIKALCTRKVTIPMRPNCESLNAAAAAAVLMWETVGRYI